MRSAVSCQQNCLLYLINLLKRSILYHLRSILNDKVNRDHITPISAIADDWLAERSLATADIAVYKDESLANSGDRFVDTALEADWQAYHKDRAEYQWLAPADNIRKSNRLDFDGGE